MSLPPKCMGCATPRPGNGGKWCSDCAPSGKTTRLEKALTERNASITRLGDRIHELETLLNERNAQLAEARHFAEMLVGADRQWRQRERLLESEIERLRGERGLHG